MSVQSLNALEKANEVRLAQRDLKADVRAGRVDWRDVLRDPPECAATLRVVSLLQSAPRMGAVRVDRAMRAAGVIPTKRIGTLTANQVESLCGLRQTDLESFSPRRVESDELKVLRQELWKAQRENDRLSRALERMHNERLAAGRVAA